MTEKRGVGLGVRHADCQAAIFYDPKKHVIAGVHAGWRGNVKNIYKKTIQQMKRTYGTNPKDLIVCISPSLGPSNAEFTNYKTELPESFWRFKEQECHFNLWEIASGQLIELGVPEDQIEIASICTFDHENDFFSFRRERKTGRNLTLCGII